MHPVPPSVFAHIEVGVVPGNCCNNGAASLLSQVRGRLGRLGPIGHLFLGASALRWLLICVGACVLFLWPFWPRLEALSHVEGPALGGVREA
jgi:hypothetical protein